MGVPPTPVVVYHRRSAIDGVTSAALGLTLETNVYLFFDTETSDLPRDFRAPETDIHNWPHLVQLGWVSTDRGGTITDSHVHTIRPEGFQISAESIEKHGISTEHALKHGEPLLDVLQLFVKAADAADVAIAHNVEFDSKVIGAAFTRARSPNPLRGKSLRCTMKESTNYCQIPSRNGRGFKWPSLEELHRRLFQTPVDGAHDALNDCLACMRCYFRLRELGVMS